MYRMEIGENNKGDGAFFIKHYVLVYLRDVLKMLKVLNILKDASAGSVV